MPKGYFIDENGKRRKSKIRCCICGADQYRKECKECSSARSFEVLRFHRRLAKEHPRYKELYVEAMKEFRKSREGEGLNNNDKIK